jgi:hypothetical protein
MQIRAELWSCLGPPQGGAPGPLAGERAAGERHSLPEPAWLWAPGSVGSSHHLTALCPTFKPLPYIQLTQAALPA